MFKRAYAIALKPGLDPHTVDDLVRVLEDAPRHIPGMTASIVRPALGPGPYDLIWDNAFAGKEFYDGYLSHPYHCNVIDHYMYRESPAAVIDEALCLRWSDGDTHVATVTEVSTVDAHEGPLFLVEHVDVAAGRVREYLDAVEEHYLPWATAHGIERTLCLRSSQASGENELVFVWKLADWNAYVDFRAFFQFDNEPASTEWVARVSALRTGGRRRLMTRTE